MSVAVDREHTGPVQAYQITQPQTSQQGYNPKYMSALGGGFGVFLIFLMSTLKMLDGK